MRNSKIWWLTGLVAIIVIIGVLAITRMRPAPVTEGKKQESHSVASSRRTAVVPGSGSQQSLSGKDKSNKQQLKQDKGKKPRRSAAASTASKNISKQGTQTAERKQATAGFATMTMEERTQRIDTWESFVDTLSEKESVPTLEESVAFKENFLQLHIDDRLDAMQHTLHLLPDDQFALLYPILFDVTMDREILEEIFSDGLNHDEEIKVPMMKEIYKNREHPLFEEAERILDVTGELDTDQDDDNTDT